MVAEDKIHGPFEGISDQLQIGRQALEALLGEDEDEEEVKEGARDLLAIED